MLSSPVGTGMSEKRVSTFSAIFAIAAIGLPVVYVLGAFGGPPGDSVELVLPVLIVVFSAIRIQGILGSDQFALLAATFWSFIYITCGVVPIVQICTGTFTYLASSDYLFPASALILIAMLCYQLGRTWGRKSYANERAGALHIISEREIHVFGFLSVFASTLGIGLLGGPRTFFVSRAEFGLEVLSIEGGAAGSQVVPAIVMGLTTVPILFATMLSMGSFYRSEERTLSKWLWLGCLLIVCSIVNSPFANPRYWVLTVVIALVFSHPGFSLTQFRASVAFGVAAAVLLFPVSDHFFRYSAQYRPEISNSGLASTLASKDFDQWKMTANGMWWVANNGHLFGRQLLGALCFWVPRSFWEDKPRDTGVVLGEALGMSNTNLSSPLPLEMWIDFGWVGVVLAFLVIGFGSMRLDSRFSVSHDRTRAVVALEDVIAPVVAGYTFILMRGPLLQSMGRLSIVVLLLLVLRACSQRTAVNGPGFDGSSDSRNVRRHASTEEVSR